MLISKNENLDFKIYYDIRLGFQKKKIVWVIVFSHAIANMIWS